VLWFYLVIKPEPRQTTNRAVPRASLTQHKRPARHPDYNFAKSPPTCTPPSSHGHLTQQRYSRRHRSSPPPPAPSQPTRHYHTSAKPRRHPHSQCYRQARTHHPASPAHTSRSASRPRARQAAGPCPPAWAPSWADTSCRPPRSAQTATSSRRPRSAHTSRRSMRLCTGRCPARMAGRLRGRLG
jgi:hypothetical protein